MKRDKSTRPAALTRRELLACTALGGLAMAMPPVLLGQPALQSVTLGDNLHLVTGAGCNVLVAVGPNEVLVVDGGLRDASAALLQTIATLAGGKPVTTLFNTNWRPEHCGLNYELGPAGASIIAHENTRLWQNNDFTVPWEDTHYRPMPTRARANASSDTRLKAYFSIAHCHIRSW